MQKHILFTSLIVIFCILIGGSIDVKAQVARERYQPGFRFGFNQYRYVIDAPTAGILDPGYFDTSMRMYANGGLLGRIHIGLSDKLMFGVSYGGENIIGEGKVNWNPQPGVNLRLRLYKENYNVPAVAIGFDSQGYGAFRENITKEVVSLDSTGAPIIETQTVNVKRYVIKSKGFYLVFSKNYAFFTNMGVHVGINYSLENKDGDNDVSIFTGFDLSLNDELALVGEFDFATNDDDKDAFGKGKGYFNLALRWGFARDFYLQFAMKNILENKENVNEPIRELKIVYIRNIAGR